MDEVARPSFFPNYTTSTLGLGIGESGLGARDGSGQRNFRSILMAQAKTRQLPSDPEYQCPITKQWLLDIEMVAIHLFPRASGELTMMAIFGPDAKGEL
ncbi:MAG: hypothetical protein Q9183_007948, partial [Haloplaca sp. 2 TL-2023]